MSVSSARVLLASLIAVRATAFLFSKILLQDMGPFTLMGERFLAAFFLLAVLFWRRLRHIDAATLAGGLAVGLCFFVVMAFELCSLETTDTHTVSFLENTAIVLVPLMEAALLRRLPAPRVVVAAIVALCGVGMLLLGGGVAVGFSLGEALALGAAVSYATAMIVTQRASQKADAFAMGIVQIGVIGACGMVCAMFFETPVLPTAPLDWAAMAVLVVVCSGFGFVLQPVAQKPLPAEEASLMCAINPFVATVLGVVVLGEEITLLGVCGLVLILAAIALSCMPTKAKGSSREEGLA